MTSSPELSVVILDTCVFSFIYKDSPLGAAYVRHLQAVIPAVTFITVGELYKGAYKNNWSPRSISNLQQYLSRYMTLPYDPAVVLQWGRIKTATPGRDPADNDAWIAACAITFGCTLLTHNRSHFEHIPGLSIVSYAP